MYTVDAKRCHTTEFFIAVHVNNRRPSNDALLQYAAPISAGLNPRMLPEHSSPGAALRFVVRQFSGGRPLNYTLQPD